MSLEKYLASPSRNSIEDLAQIVTSEELSDALRLYNEVKRESERAAAMVSAPSTSNIPVQDEHTNKGNSNVCLYNFSCSLCNEIFENQDDLTSHNCLHDPNVNVMYECQECRTLFQSLDALAQHMKIHEENVLVVRSTCIKKAPQDYDKGKVGYLCPICDKVLSSKGSVMKHQELHKGLKPYVCSFCGKCFSIKGNKDKHEQIHAGERPYKCHICEKSFTLKGNLKKHLLTHTNFKEYKCGLCQKEFSLKGNLDKHLKRHEKGFKPRQKIVKVQQVDDDTLMEIDGDQTAENLTNAERRPTPGGFRIKIIEFRGHSQGTPSVQGVPEDGEKGQGDVTLETNVKEINENFPEGNENEMDEGISESNNEEMNENIPKSNENEMDDTNSEAVDKELNEKTAEDGDKDAIKKGDEKQPHETAQKD